MPRKTQIFSIFGECEAAAAEHFIERGMATRIARDMIPSSVAVNEQGQTALFAVVVPGEHITQFNKMCRDLRS